MSWPKERLGNHCDITSSKRIFFSEYVESGIPFYRSKEIIEKNQGREISEPLFISQQKYNDIKNKYGVPAAGDMLLTSVGTIGIPYIVKPNDQFYFKDGNLTWFRNFDAMLSSQFLRYWIGSSEGYGILNNSTIGSSQKALTISALCEIECPLPPIGVQEHIVDILSAYDDLIETNQRQINLLEEAAQRLYREWFVDLRFPGHEDVPVVDGVPEGWKKKTMADVCQAIGGGTPSTTKKEYYEGGTIRWVTPTDLTKTGSWILLDTEKKITQEGLNNSSAKIVPPNTILMTSRASIGYIAICEQEVCTNQGFISCVPYNEQMRYYLMFNLLSRVEEIKSKATGSTFLEIAKRTFREMIIIEPAEDDLVLFNSTIIPMMEQIKALRKQTEALTIARDRLLPKLMSGEIAI